MFITKKMVYRGPNRVCATLGRHTLPSQKCTDRHQQGDPLQPEGKITRANSVARCVHCLGALGHVLPGGAH